jgi:hypothetical protein
MLETIVGGVWRTSAFRARKRASARVYFGFIKSFMDALFAANCPFP